MLGSKKMIEKDVQEIIDGIVDWDKCHPKPNFTLDENQTIISVIDSWHSRFGPEGLFEIADIMKSIARKDVEEALQESAFTTR
jgi:hypothetical protein